MQGKRSPFDYLERADSADDARLYAFQRESRLPLGYFDDEHRSRRAAVVIAAVALLISAAGVAVLLYVVFH